MRRSSAMLLLRIQEIRSTCAPRHARGKAVLQALSAELSIRILNPRNENMELDSLLSCI